jgi:Rod binding domain-containing protein
MSGLGINTALPPIDAAVQPADIRNGNAQAKQAYQEALGFEDILVQQLTQQLAATVTTPDASTSSDGSSNGSSDSTGTGGILGSDPSTSAFASLIPTALSQSIMSGGGVGIADSLARAIDPAIGTPQGSASTAKAKS